MTHWSRIHGDDLRKLIEAQMTNKQIAALYGLSVSQVQVRITQCNLVGCRYMGRPWGQIGKRDKRVPHMQALRRRGKTLKDIGVKYGITAEGVRQILKRDNRRSAERPRIDIKQQQLVNQLKPKIRKLSPATFLRQFQYRMLSWLYGAGYQSCVCCDQVKPGAEFRPEDRGRIKGLWCQACNNRPAKKRIRKKIIA